MTSPNGYTTLPPGKLANAVTWLELTDFSKPSKPAPAGFSSRRLGPDDAALYHALYRAVGTPWLWAGMLGKSEADLANYLARDSGQTLVACDNGKPSGVLDLETTYDNNTLVSVEVVNLGLIPSAMGKGAGAWLMAHAVHTAAAMGANRLWLHTCNFDHPGALAFYQRQGFKVYAQGFEIMDDPRHLGLLPDDAAPHVPRCRQQ